MKRLRPFGSLIALCAVSALLPESALSQTSGAEPTDNSVQTAADPAASSVADDPAAAAAAAKAREKQLKEWKRLYGAGPYPDEIEAYLADKPELLKPFYKTLFTGGERNAVLNFQRLGLAAMETGHWEHAERAFEGSLQRIEAIYADNPQAEAARSTFRKEANKAFKGEPYERAMAYYYRGLLYLKKGDYENARAVFKSAEYQDTISEEETFQGDFALMNYLVGWASRCNGQPAMAEDAFAAAQAAKPEFPLPEAAANVLLIVEMGQGPMKVKDGRQKEKLVFSPTPGKPENAAVFTVTPANGKKITFTPLPISSVYEQATTRGGRAIDGILAGKASFKSTTEDIGNASMSAGLQMMSSGYGEAGAYTALAGALFSAFSSAMKADADIRMWDTLPDTIAVATGALASDDWKHGISFSDGTEEVPLTATPLLRGGNEKCTLLWTRSRSVLDASSETPGDDPAVMKSLSRKKNIQDADRRFRSELVGS